MATTTSARTVEVAIPSAILSTITVLVVDVLVVLLLHHSLLKMGTLLAMRQLLAKKKALRVSELWFEYLTGRTHGPPWFRYVQALLKTIVFAASIVLSLSLNGSSRDLLERIPGQTILVQNPRNLDNVGLGYQASIHSKNISQELSFTLQIQSCTDQDPNKVVYHNLRSKIPLTRTYLKEPPGFECLTTRRNYSQPPLLSMDANQKVAKHCTVAFTRQSSVEEGALGPNSSAVKGKFSAAARGCNGSALSFDCFEGPFRTACLAHYIADGTERITAVFGDSKEFNTEVSLRSVPPLRRGNDTLAIVARYVAYDPSIDVAQWYLAAVHQAAPNSTVHAIRGQQSVTEINLLLFRPSSAIIGTVLVSCCVLGLASMALMIYSHSDVLDLGFSPQEVARLAAMEHGKRQESNTWYLHMHPHQPCITVSTDSTKKGHWAEELVQNKYRKRH